MIEESLFLEVLAQTFEDRACFLQPACAGQPELRAAVEALLAAHLKHDNLLDRPAAELIHTRESDAAPLSERNATATADFGRDSAVGIVIAGRYVLQEDDKGLRIQLLVEPGHAAVVFVTKSDQKKPV